MTQTLARSRRLPAVVLAVALLGAGPALQGCAEHPTASRAGGAVAGGVAGGILGSMVGGGTGRLIATGIGASLGALAGSEIGAAMSRADKREHQQALGTALEDAPTNRTVAWENPDTGARGRVTPTETYRRGGQYCREYQQTVTVGGETRQAYGTACRQPDGSWKIVS